MLTVKHYQFTTVYKQLNILWEVKTNDRFRTMEGFEQGKWCDDIDTRDFIQMNYTPYDGDESFLAGPTDATNKLWG